MKFVDVTDQAASHDPKRDIPNRREVYLDNGRVFRLERRDPYGFVYVVWDKGPAPAALSGSFTDFAKAKHALTLWVNNNTHDKIVLEKVEKPAPVLYKKAYRDPETGKNLELSTT